MRLTVLHAIPSFVGGGAERQLSLLAPELCRLGVNVHVAYLHAGVNLAPLAASSVQLHRLMCGGNHDPRLLLRLLQLIRTTKPDVIQTWLPQMDILAGMAAKLSAVPFVLSERSSALAYRGGWKNRLRRLVGRHANVIISNSQGGLDYWGRQGNAGHVIRNGLALQAIRSATPLQPAALGLSAETRIVLFAGRLSGEKNVSNLLLALDKVLDTQLDCAAVLFGDGPQEAALRAQIAGMRRGDRVRLAAYTPDLWRWMRRASAFVSVSEFEGNPNTVLEAMAVGCPLVVSAIAAHREILDDSMARFCNPTEVDDIAAAIDAVLRAPDQAATRAASARQAADAWSIGSVAHAYLEIYGEIVRRRGLPESD